MLRVFNSNGLKVYALSAGKSIPQFAAESLKNKRKLKYDPEYQHCIDLIHDFEFPQCCETIAVSPNLQYIIATGVYPPQIGIYDTAELSLKHRRDVNNQIFKTCFLEDDYTKLAFLCANRVIEFHNRGGRHHLVRIPREGRDMKYLSDHANLFTVTSSNEVFRLNLEKGIFEKPLTSVSCELNCLSENPILPLVSAGGSECALESWDLRCNQSVSRLCCDGSVVDADESITSCAYSSSGLKIAVGTSSGTLKVYDIRNKRPIWEVGHVNGYPVNCIEWLQSLNHSITDNGNDSLIAWSDNKSVRVQAAEDGKFIASIEGLVTSEKHTSLARINGFCFYPNSGICFVVGDQTRVGTYFIPSIGAAPRWCSFLENITEEMELANATSTGISPANTRRIYDEFVFVTRQQLEELSATDLIGTTMVKDYMHGYFINGDTYKKLKTVMSDFDYESYKKQKIQEKIDAKRQMRLPLRQKKTIKVNTEYVEKLEASAATLNAKGLTKKQKEQAIRAKSALEDERFARIFTDENFAIDHIDADAVNYTYVHKNSD